MLSIDSRRFTCFAAYAVTLSALSALSAACAAKGTGPDGFTPTDAGVDGATVDGGVPDDSAGGGFGDVSVPDTGLAGDTIFYAHTGRELYKVDAKDPNLGVTLIGAFDCIEQGPPAGKDTSITDVAVDRAGRLYAVGPRMIFSDITISGSTVQCFGKGTPLPAGQNSQFNGASFAPVGTVDANAEALVVGDSKGDLYKVDTNTGAVTLLGNFGIVPANDGRGHNYPNDGGRWQLSGDIVFLENNGNPVGFATVRDCSGTGISTCNKTDTLIELDLKKLAPNNTQSVTKSVRGQIVKAMGCQDNFADEYGSMYGIAAYQGDIIGFSRDSFIVKIDNNRGGACRIADHAGAIQQGFAGAGVTTLAPVTAPPQ